MNTFNITLPTSFDVASRGMSVTVDLSKLSPEIVAKLVLHGLTQKVADAAAGAGKVAGDGADAEKVALTGKALMQKVVDNLVAGNWGIERGQNAAEPAINRFIRDVVRAALSDASRKAYKESNDRNVFLMAKFDGAPEDVQANIRKAAERLMEIDADRVKTAKKAGAVGL